MSARSFRRAREHALEREEKQRRRLSGRSKAAIAAGAGLGATVLFAPAADAATFTVTNLNDSGDGSLRDAVDEANNSPGSDAITFQSGLSGQITLTTGEIVIEEALDVQGPGASSVTVSGDDASRIFYIDPTTDGSAYDPVRISGLTLSHGSGSQGGALYSENATLTLENTVFADNYASSGGGAVYSDEGKLIILNSSFTGNVVDAGEGGAVYVDNTEDSAADDVEVLIEGSTFTGNVSADGDGGALYLDAEGDVAIGGTTFANNRAGEATAFEFGDTGGAIQVSEIAGDLTIRNSTISANTAFYGGGVYVDDVEGGFLLENSTVSGNRAIYDGGGVYLGTLTSGQQAEIRNSTIVGNSAGENLGDYGGPYGGGGVFLYDESDSADDNGPVTISSSIVANNTVAGPSVVGPDLWSQEFADGFIAGFSLIGNTADALIAENPAGSNITGVDPQLGPLANNGGPTQTHLPALTSPAIDAGIANGLTTDQRGLARTAELSSAANRPGSDGTDIGSVEIQTASCQGSFVPSKVGTDAGETITGTDGPDAISALGGDDTASGLAANDCVDGGDGKDNLKGDQGKDSVKGAGGNDKVDGGKGKDKAAGGEGKDAVKGGKGKDKMKGNGGKDKMKAADGFKDKVNCGGGKDKATVDAKDKVAKNCETVKVKK